MTITPITPMVPTDDEIDAVVQTCRERGLREFDVFRAVLWTFQQPTPAAQAVESVERDAARYRWLRELASIYHKQLYHTVKQENEQNDASLSGIGGAVGDRISATAPRSTVYA